MNFENCYDVKAHVIDVRITWVSNTVIQLQKTQIKYLHLGTYVIPRGKSGQ